jgi:PAS domain S-box-containing protein
MFGFASPKEVLAIDTLAELVSPEHRELMVERGRARLRGEPVPNRYEFRGLRRDGRPIWVETLATVVPWIDGPAIQSTAIDITDRKRAEEQLRLSEMSYRSLFEANHRILEYSPAGIVLLDRDLRVVYENPEARAIYGLSPRDFSGSIGRRLDEIEPLRGVPVGHVLARLQSGRKAELDANVRNLAGEAVALAIQAVPILEQERLAGAVMLISDVTDRRRQDEALRKQERLLKALAEVRLLLLQARPWAETVDKALGVLGRIMGVDHVMVFVHEGADRPDLLRATLRHEWCAEGLRPYREDPAFWSATYLKSGFRRWHERFAQRLPVNDRVQDLPATERWVFERQGIRSAVAVPVYSGPVCWGFIGFTDHRQERRWSAADEAILQAIAESLGHRIERDAAEERLRASEERFSRHLSQVPVMMFQLLQRSDGSRCYPYVSQVGLQALGLTAEEVKRSADPMHDRIHPADRIVFERLMNESFATLSPKRWEGRYYNGKGEQGWAELIARPSRLENGDMVWDGFIMDISGRKRAELDLLRRPAQGQAGDRTAEWLRSLRRIEREVKALAVAAPSGAAGGAALESIRDLIARSEAARPVQPALLPALLTESARRCLHGTGVRYELHVPPDLDPVPADPSALRDILSGLFSAALQAMPEGGKLNIRAGNVRIEGGSFAGLEPGLYVRVLVQGEMSRLSLARDAEPPAHGHEQAFPAGLVQTLELVTAQRGWLAVQAQPDRGPQLTLYLPSATLRLAAGVENVEPARNNAGS